MKNPLWHHWSTFLLGVWLILSPWALPALFGQTYGGAAPYWNAIACGLLLAIFGIVAMTDDSIWQEWGDVLVAVWLFASPWLLGFANFPVTAWNVCAVGVLTLVLAAWNIYQRQPVQRT